MKILNTLILGASIGLGASASQAQIVRDFHGLRGTLWSTSIEDQAGGGSAAITSPAQVLVITQFCAQKTYRDSQDGTKMMVTLQTPLLRIALPDRNGNAHCQTFEPGFMVPPSSPITCDVNSTVSSANCNVTGVLIEQ